MNKNRQNKRKHNPSNIKYRYSEDKHFMPNCNVLCGKLLLAEIFKPLKLRYIINTRTKRHAFTNFSDDNCAYCWAFGW